MLGIVVNCGTTGGKKKTFVLQVRLGCLVKSQVLHQAGAYLRFRQHEAARSISTPPCMGC